MADLSKEEKISHSNPIIIETPGFLKKKGIDEKSVREALAAVFYNNGVLSEKEACEITNSTRRQFEETILPKYGLSVLGGLQEDVDFETAGL